MSCYLKDMSCPSPTVGKAPEIFFSAMKFLYASQCLITEDWPTDSCINNNEKFDFIIVGAGSAGCVVANRLSEDKNVKILILEAGGIPPAESIIPRLSTSMYHTEADWEYYTISTGKTNDAQNNKSVYWPRGKMLGGSSSINGMLYVRGARDDYQVWYDAKNKEWHPDIVEKYFKKAENLQNLELLKTSDGNMYGQNGPLVINKCNSSYQYVINNILKSYNEIGIKNVLDLNSANLFGSGIITSTAFNGVRESTAKAYLIPAKNRSNLKILTNAFVRKVLINKLKEAYGVIVKYKGKLRIFLATREIILCSGSINSPHLLMLSGVGSKKHLTSKNINCKVDQPNVGQNLEDHCLVQGTIYANGPSQPYDTTYGAIEYLYNRTGYLSQSTLESLLAFYSKYENSSRADYQMHLLIYWKNSSQIESSFGKSVFNFKPSLVEVVKKQNKNQTLYAFVFNLLHPRSKGNITLKSSNPEEHPLIYPNYFEDDADADDCAQGIMRIINNLIETEYFRSINANIGLFWEPCLKYGIGTFNYWKCICLSTVTTVYHPVGTCRMGPDPKTAVVDGRLRVYGVKKLRVIDASIMPNITTGNTNGPTIMIAERGSDLIKEEYNLK